MLIVNSYPIIEEKDIISLIYNSNENLYEESNSNNDANSDEDKEESNTKNHFNTKVIMNKNIIPEGPSFEDEKEPVILGQAEEPKSEPGFFSKYVKNY